MMKTKLITMLFASLIIAGIVLTGCTVESIVENAAELIEQQTNEENLINKKFTAGEWNENTYTNEFFGMTATESDVWTILSKEEITELFGIVSDFYDELGADEIDFEQLEDVSIPLFTLFNYNEFGVPSENIICLCTYSPLFNKDIAFEGIKQTISAQYESLGTVTFGEKKTTNFGDLEAIYMDVDVLYNPDLTDGVETHIYQRIYMMKYKRYYIELSTTSETYDSPTVNEFINSITFS